MKSYNQSVLFQALISAAFDVRLRPDPGLIKSYKRKRLNMVRRVLLARNLFLYTSGYRDTLLDLSASGPTVYTQPVGHRLLLLGYANNLRYGATTQSQVGAPQPTTVTRLLPQMHRLRIPGRAEPIFCADLTPGQAGIAGEPCYTDIHFITPTVLEANEQVAVDLGYDPTAGTAPANVPPEAFIIYALKINSSYSAEDLEILRDCERFIDNNDFQRGLILNALRVPTQQAIRFSPSATIGVLARAETRPVSNPVLVTAIGTNLGASTVHITDTGSGTSFSLNRPMQSSVVGLPNYEDSGFTNTAPVGGPRWTNYFTLPFPHLLRTGAQLRVDLVSGGDDGGGGGTPNIAEVTGGTRPKGVMLFKAITV